jgi:NAD(P)-dependent dehydrogenase (short-subunit alcohol dehydrogenase family)
VKSVIVTGSNGGIGTAICNHLKQKNYSIIGVDKYSDCNNLDEFVNFDVGTLADCKKHRQQFFMQVSNCIKGTELVGLVNNAAIQILGSLEEVNVEDFSMSLNTNVIAPFVMTKLFLKQLESNNGSVVNIGSIHAKLTKPGFISYATSKTALLGLTQSIAVDCGSRIRVNAIQPAATATEMLLAGFEGKPDALSVLKKYHPTNSIANPIEIAKAVEFLISDSVPFANGTILDINGGIGSRLHDPV